MATNEPAKCTGILGASCKAKYLYSAWLTNVYLQPFHAIDFKLLFIKTKQNNDIGGNCLPGQKYRIATFMDITNKEFNSLHD